MLASVPRAAAEFSSNLSFALIYNPKAFAEGMSKYHGFAAGVEGLEVMRNVRSQQIERLYPASKLSSAKLDTQAMSQASGIKKGKSRNDILNKATIAYNYTVKPVTNVTEVIADALISSPDKIVMKPMWFGSFASEFKKIAGEEVNFEKISENNEVYLTKHAEAIKAATNYADETSVRVGASDNPFTGILKGANSADQSAALQTYNKFNNFMTRFLNYEYTTARSGVYALMKEGKMNQRQGIAILTASMSRMIMYNYLVRSLGEAFMSLLGFEDDEDDRSFWQKLGQATMSAFTGILIGRNFGNVTKIPLNMGIEKMNKDHFDFLRNEEYDPYTHSIQHTIVPADKGKQGDIVEYIKAISGPYSPVIGTAARIVKVAAKEPKTQEAQERRLNELKYRSTIEVAGALGAVPFYRDVRKATLAWLYKDIKKSKGKGSSGAKLNTKLNTKLKTELK
jgi:hypothetical protein